ncbi:MAG: hypothetical protein ACLQDQ_04540 [Myxococcaceae bacterium]
MTSNALFASSRQSRSLGLIVAASILFAVGVGGSGALVSAYTGASAQSPVAASAVRV